MSALAFIILNIAINLDHSMSYVQYNFALIKKHRNTHTTSNRRRDLSLLTDGYVHPQISNDYFYAILNIGEPTSQHIEIALDTGSSLPYFACKSTCVLCGVHDDPPFNINKSTSFNWISCNNALCHPKGVCTNNKCEWKLHYVDGSSISALVGSDLIAFNNNKNMTKLPLVFGCSVTEANTVYNQGADGIMGLSMAPESFINQIFNIDNIQHILGQKQFAHCFGNNSGLLTFGSLQINNILNTFDIQLQWTPLITQYNSNGWYKVKTVGFKVEMNSEKIDSDTAESIEIQYVSDIDSGYHGTVLDTGSSTLSVPGNVASTIRDGILSLVHSNIMLNRDMFEWQTDSTRNYDYFLKWNGQITFDEYKWNEFIENYMQLFPDIVMLWDAATQEPVEFRVQPAQYLLFKGSHICLDLFGDVSSVLVGSNVMINKLIVYDVQNMRLGVFDNIDCDLLAVHNHTDPKNIVNINDTRTNITFESTIATVNDSIENNKDNVYELSTKSPHKSLTGDSSSNTLFDDSMIIIFGVIIMIICVLMGIVIICRKSKKQEEPSVQKQNALQMTTHGCHERTTKLLREECNEGGISMDKEGYLNQTGTTKRWDQDCEENVNVDSL